MTKSPEEIYNEIMLVNNRNYVVMWMSLENPDYVPDLIRQAGEIPEELRDEQFQIAYSRLKSKFKLEEIV